MPKSLHSETLLISVINNDNKLMFKNIVFCVGYVWFVLIPDTQFNSDSTISKKQLQLLRLFRLLKCHNKRNYYSKISLIETNWERKPCKLVRDCAIEILLKMCSGNLMNIICLFKQYNFILKPRFHVMKFRY